MVAKNPRTNDSAMSFQVKDAMRIEFMKICRDNNRNASIVLRDFVADYVAKHREKGASNAPVAD